MKKITLLKVALLSGAATTLAACGGHHSNSTQVTTPVVVPTLEEQFGTAFSTDFNAMANSQPVTPMTGDIIPLTLTAQPVALH